MSEFSDRVAVHFGFLTDEYGFSLVRTNAPIGELVQFKRDPLAVSIGWYKGEIDVSFSVGLQFAMEHEIFRPYTSRTFRMQEIVLRKDEDAYTSLERVGIVTTMAQADAVLTQEAMIMKRYCQPLLAGDLAQLESITLERRSNAHA